MSLARNLACSRVFITGLFPVIVAAQTVLAQEPALTAPARQPGKNGGVVGGIVTPGSKASAAVNLASSWTLDQRLANRCNPLLARERVREHENGTRALGVVAAQSQPGGRSADIISGRWHPELFLPHELFETLVTNGILDPAGRSLFALKARDAGLPYDFWARLEPLSSAYLADLSEQRRLRSDRSAAGRALALSRNASLDSKACRDRAVALSAARVAFGPALDQFMYAHVAPNLTVYLDEPSDERVLRSRERGCQ